MTSIFNDEVCRQAVRAAYARKYPQWFFNDATEEDWCHLAEVENCKEKLKATIRTKLANFPHVEKYYRDLIERRIMLPCPLENSLVLLLCDGGLKKLDQRLSSVEIREPQLLERIFNELSGKYTKASKMDARIEHAWAEIMASDILMNYIGFKQLKKPLPGEGPSKKRPDFEGVHCTRGRFLVEVTTLNYYEPIDTVPGECSEAENKNDELAQTVNAKLMTRLKDKAESLKIIASRENGKEKLNLLIVLVTPGQVLSDCAPIVSKEAVSTLINAKVLPEVLLIFDTGPTFVYLNVPSRLG